MHRDALIEQTVIAALASKVIQMLKMSDRFPWVSQHTKAANRALSMLIAVATSAGFAVAWSGSIEAGGVLTIGVPSLQGIVEFAYHAGYSFIAQEASYRGLIEDKTKPEEPKQ
jgi:hypothetical protein